MSRTDIASISRPPALDGRADVHGLAPTASVFASRLRLLPTAQAGFAAFEGFVRDLGFTAVSYWVVRAPSIHPLLSFSSAPDAWWRHDDRSLRGGVDPILDHARVETLPFKWSITDWPGDQLRPSRDYMEEAGRLGIAAGVAAGRWGPRQHQSFYKFFGSPGVVDRLELRELNELVVAMAHFDSHLLATAKVLSGQAGSSRLLTPREVLVMRLVAQGESNKATASELGWSEKAVRASLEQIIEKLCARNRVDAVRRASQFGLLA